jgi:hypothetical protein
MLKECDRNDAWRWIVKGISIYIYIYMMVVIREIGE